MVDKDGWCSLDLKFKGKNIGISRDLTDESHELPIEKYNIFKKSVDILNRNFNKVKSHVANDWMDYIESGRYDTKYKNAKDISTELEMRDISIELFNKNEHTVTFGITLDLPVFIDEHVPFTMIEIDYNKSVINIISTSFEG